MRRFLLGAACLVSGCLDTDIAPLFLTAEGAASVSLLASGAQSFHCVVAVYLIPRRSSPPATLTNFAPWSDLAITQRLPDTAIEFRVLSNAQQCWTQAIVAAAGSTDQDSLLSKGTVLNTFSSNGKVAVFDPERGLFIALSG